MLTFTGQNNPRQKPFFRAALQSDGTLEILIYEEIGEDFWSMDGGVTAKTIKQQIDQAGNYSKILMRINSPGGDAFEGIAIYNLIAAQKKPVEVCVDGIAASAASIIAMSGGTITMGPNAMMMIHNAWGVCMGDAADMRKMGGALDKISGAISQTYVARTKKPEAEIKAMMDAETWMTAQECLDGGFATQITPDPQTEQAALAMARRFKSLAKLKRVPEGLKNDGAVECACSCGNCLAGDCTNCMNAACEDANCEDCPMQSAAADRAKLAPQGTAAPELSSVLAAELNNTSAPKETPKEAPKEVADPVKPEEVIPISNLSFYEAQLAMLQRGMRP